MFRYQFVFSCMFFVAIYVSMSMGDELSQEEKDLIVSMHNKIRSEVNPAVKPPLQNLEWDEQLASKAEQWAQGCDWSHNKDKSSDLGTVGENIAINQDPIHGGISHWETEKKAWKHTNSDSGCPDGSCGHYTQMIWAATTKIGCGVYTCSKFTSSEGDDMRGFDGYKYLVCDYYPPGNYPGVPPYKTKTGAKKTTGGGGKTTGGTPTGGLETTAEGKPTDGLKTKEEEKPTGGKMSIDKWLNSQ